MAIIRTLLTAATATGAGSSVIAASPTYAGTSSSSFTFQATVVGTGAVEATVLIQVSNDATNWLTLGTITLSGTTSASDGFAAEAAWLHVRANCTAISGTAATVDVLMGVGK